MPIQNIKCPKCNSLIPIDEAINSQLRDEIEKELSSVYSQKEKQWLADAQQQKKDFEANKQKIIEDTTKQNELRFRSESKAKDDRILELSTTVKEIRDEQSAWETKKKHEEDAIERRRQALVIEKESFDEFVSTELEKQKSIIKVELEASLRKKVELEFTDLQNEKDEIKKQLEIRNRTELELRAHCRTLEQAKRDAELAAQQKFDAERQTIIDSTSKAITEKNLLANRENEKLIADLRTQLDDVNRKLEQGSQQLQGEVLELELETIIRDMFPQDSIEPIAKGTKGADVLQRIIGPMGKVCGSILWETKNAKNWNKQWIDKLKDDQIEAGADLAIILTTALPKEVKSFALIDGIFVTDFHSIPAAATTLRVSLIQLALSKSSLEGATAKRDLLFEYFSSAEFRNRMEAIVKTLVTMKQQLGQEQRAMTKQWALREKQIERVVLTTSGMYGQLQAILGSDLPQIDELEYPEMTALDASGDAIDN